MCRDLVRDPRLYISIDLQQKIVFPSVIWAARRFRFGTVVIVSLYRAIAFIRA
jgi:hypothetical protein